VVDFMNTILSSWIAPQVKSKVSWILVPVNLWTIQMQRISGVGAVSNKVSNCFGSRVVA
tara:strand:+ start:502 stop:678 length:177 start_codon:yes stop_codon:yes gene_type:complete